MQLPHPKNALVTPRECALAITIPLTRQGFLDDLANGEKTFASSMKQGWETAGATNELYWEHYYEPVARVVERLCNSVEELGVTVIRSANLPDLTKLLQKFQVITLVAHWRFAKILPSDILDPVSFLTKLQQPHNDEQRVTREAVVQIDPDLLDTQSDSRLTESAVKGRIVRTLNTVIASAHRPYSNNRTKTHQNSDITSRDMRPEILINPLRRLTRAFLEQAFPDLIVPAPSLEFDDGMHTILEVVEAIPIAFCRLLDLTVCNSVILGQAIKSHRPSCLVAVNRYPAQVHVRMALYELAIRRLTRRPGAFIDVLTEVYTSRV